MAFLMNTMPRNIGNFDDLPLPWNDPIFTILVRSDPGLISSRGPTSATSHFVACAHSSCTWVIDWPTKHWGAWPSGGFLDDRFVARGTSRDQEYDG